MEYSHSNLSPDAQDPRACLTPFSGVFNTQWISQYTQKLRAQPALSGLPFERWTEVLLEATEWGLLSPLKDAQVYVQIQPVLPYFLRSRLGAQALAERKAAVEAAFRAHYTGMGGALRQWMN